MDLKRRSIGNTGLSVTELGFGGAPIGAVGGHLSDNQAVEILHQAWSGGIRYFDTAPLYGHGLSEKRLALFSAEVDRGELVVSTKVGRLLVPRDKGVRFAGMRDSEDVAIQYDYSADGVRRSIESSLERLGLDRVDILLCHDIDTWTHGTEQPEVYKAASNGALPEMHRLREEGVVSAIGLGVNESAVCVRVLKEFEPDCFLLAGRFTLLEQEPLDEMLPMCLEKNVSVIIGGPYNSGILSRAERRRATYDYKPVPDDLWQRAQKIRAICDEHGVDLRTAALQYPLKYPAIASIIPGMWSRQEVEQNLEFVQRTVPESLWSDLVDANLARKW